MAQERVPTGIEGLDELIEGGFIKNSVNLVCGKTGTGKTAFCLSFIYHGAARGEPGVYLTTEENVEDIKKDASAMFDFDIDAMERKNMLKFLFIRPVLPSKAGSLEDVAGIAKLYIFNLFDTMERVIRSVSAKRVVIDSASVIEMFIKDRYIARAALMELINRLKNMGVTVLMTTTISETESGLSDTGIIEHLVDSIIKLDFIPVAEEFKRTLVIRKMRRTRHSVLIHPFSFAKNGLKILEVE